MQRVNLHARPSIIQVGCPTCCYQVCALDHAKGDTADLSYRSQPYHHNATTPTPGGCFTNVSHALKNNIAKIYNARHHIIYGENFKLKLCTCAQSMALGTRPKFHLMALGTRAKFQLEILIRSTIPAIHKFRENILESSRNVSETTPRHQWFHDAENGLKRPSIRPCQYLAAVRSPLPP